MANSADQPDSSVAVRTSHAPSQFRLKPPPDPDSWRPPPPPPPPAPAPNGLLLPSAVTCPSVLESHGIGREDEAVLPVAIGIQDDAEAVGVVQWRIAARVGHGQTRGVSIPQHDAEVERVVRIDNPNLGPFGGGGARVRRGLPEVDERIDREPRRVVRDTAIHRRPLGDPDSSGRGRRRWWSLRLAGLRE